MKRKFEAILNDDSFVANHKLVHVNSIRLNEQNLNTGIIDNEKILPFPQEIWLLIFAYLAKTDIRSIKEVCFTFYLLSFRHQLLKKAAMPFVKYTKKIAENGILLGDVIKKQLNLQTLVSLSPVKVLQNGAILLHITHNVYQGWFSMPDRCLIPQFYHQASVIVSWQEQKLDIKSFNFPIKDNAIIQLRKNGLLLIKQNSYQLMILNPITMYCTSTELSFGIRNLIQLKSGDIYALGQNMNLYHLLFTSEGSYLGANKIAYLYDEEKYKHETDDTEDEILAKLVELEENKILILLHDELGSGVFGIYFYEIGAKKVIDFTFNVPLSNGTKLSPWEFFVANNLLYSFSYIRKHDNFKNSPKKVLYVFALGNNKLEKVAKNIDIGGFLEKWISYLLSIDSIKKTVNPNIIEALHRNQENRIPLNLMKTAPLVENNFVSVAHFLSFYWLVTWDLSLDFKSLNFHSLSVMPEFSLEWSPPYDLEIGVKENGNLVLLLPLEFDYELHHDAYFKEIIYFNPDYSLTRYLPSKDQQKKEILKLVDDTHSLNLDHPINKARNFMSAFFASRKTDSSETDEIEDELHMKNKTHK